MNVSIIIVNYNTFNYVKDCIDSILDLTLDIDYEIIVIDNNSPQRNIETLDFIYPSVNLILHNKNSGFGSANNLGAKTAVGEYLFFLNPDTILCNNAVKILYDFMNINTATRLGVCGGNLLTKDFLPNMSFSHFMPGFLNELDFFTFSFLGKLISRSKNFNYSQNSLLVKGFISGADLMISKKLFDEINGFDEEFFMYYEETELIYRVRKLNYRIYSVPQASIVHFEGASEIVKEKTVERMKNSELLYYKKTNQVYMIYVSYYLRTVRFSITALLYRIFGVKDKAAILDNMCVYLKKYRNF